MQQNTTTMKTDGQEPGMVRKQESDKTQDSMKIRKQDHVITRQQDHGTNRQQPGNITSQDHGTTRQEPGTNRQQENRLLFPKMILVTGDGRNVGKTTFCAQIIRNLSAKTEMIGIKTTPHQHGLTDGLEIIAKTNAYIVALEKGVHHKDSALLLQAGAGKVYLIMADQQHVGEAFSHISDQVQGKICVAESGSLAAYIQPGFFFFIKNHTGEIKKKENLEFKPVIVTNLNRTFDFAPGKLDIVNNQLVING